MINVALVSHSPHMHGSERSLVCLAKLFHNSRKICPFLFIPTPENGEMTTVARGFDLDILYTPPNPWYIYQSPERSEAFNLFCDTISEQIKIYIELYKTINADVVIVNTLTNFIPNVSAYLLGIPVITWIHGVLDASLIPGVDASYQTFVDQEMIRLSNRVIYCSAWTKKHFEKIVSKKHSALIPNWTPKPTNHIAYDPALKTFICLNSMEIKKGCHILVEAAKIVKDSGYTFRVDLIGAGVECQNLIDQIEFLELHDFVSIKPRTTDVEALYHHCTALIQPSFYESFGRTIIEAMSYQRPVIAASSADPENNIKDGKSGFRIDPGDSKQLAQKMIYILEHPKKAEDMGKKGYRLFKSHLDGKKAKRKLKKLIYKTSKLVTTPKEQLAFEALNRIHNNSFEMEGIDHET